MPSKVEELFDYMRRTHRRLGGVTLHPGPQDNEVIAAQILESLQEYDNKLLAAQEKRYGK